MEDKIHKGRVLIVDDEPINIELISGYLEADHEIITASNGKEALEKVQMNSPDIVLLDIMMPEMDGYTVCKKIKSQDSTRFIPVVMVTALTDIQEKIKAIESGADDFLSQRAVLFRRDQPADRGERDHGHGGADPFASARAPV